jgi:AcrR family transcriptional regulator
MTRLERRERERAQRRQVIVTAARELAEAEGWESVTTRRLAECIEYSQPVLYSHFEGKDAIVSAVAFEGFGELPPYCTTSAKGLNRPPPNRERSPAPIWTLRERTLPSTRPCSP